jgi:hypothetical protein
MYAIGCEVYHHPPFLLIAVHSIGSKYTLINLINISSSFFRSRLCHYSVGVAFLKLFHILSTIRPIWHLLFL